MKYSSTKASNAPIESNHIKKGNKTNKTPIKVQPIELNTIFGLFVNRKKNSTKKKDMRGWLHNELDEKLSKELTQIDFNSLEGKEYLDSLTSEILDIWKQE